MKTILNSQIKKVAPGEYGVINAYESLVFNKYYTDSFAPTFNGSYEEALLKIKELLFLAVKKRLQSDVPVAILLSGGIDSSAIACIAKVPSPQLQLQVLQNLWGMRC